MKLCKHSNCAVCITGGEKEREVFKYLLKTLNPETYVCKYVGYRIKSQNGWKFKVTSLEYASRNIDGSFSIKDMFTAGNVRLTMDNIEIVCLAEGECENKTPIVREYP